MTGEQQYLALAQRIIDEGEWIHNERTGKKCKVVINADLVYDVGAGDFPLLTTRKSFYKAAIAEFLGYLKGYTNAADFRALGTNTWDKNANANESWLKNCNREGVDDMGRVYGAQMCDWRGHGKSIDQLRKVYHNLKNEMDDRGEIITMWNPGEFDLGCLRPCIHEYQFSLLNGTLYLNAKQRSCDVPLGLNFNMVQLYFFLALMAQITGLKAGKVYHKIVNAHIYEDQYGTMVSEHIKRRPLRGPKLIISPTVTTLSSVKNWMNLDHIQVTNYKHLPGIKYPFSV